jgi:hypothetical protein
MWYLIALGALGLALFGLVKNKDGHARNLPLALLMSAAALIAFARGWSLDHVGVGTVLSRQDNYQLVAGRKIGSVMVAEMPEKQVLVIKPLPGMKNAELLYQGFCQEVAGRLKLIEVDLKLSDADLKTLNGLVTGEAAMPADQAALLANPVTSEFLTARMVMPSIRSRLAECDVVITFAGMPAAAEGKAFCAALQKCKLVIAQGPCYDFEQEIRSGIIWAALAISPDATAFDHRVPSNLDKAFAEQWMLVTAATIGEAKKRNVMPE